MLRDILNLENKVLEEPLDVEDILKGEDEMPDPVKNFYKALCTGDEAEKPISSRKFRFVELSRVFQKPYIHVPEGWGDFSLESIYH